MSEIMPTPDQLEAFRTHDREGPIHMLNFLKFRDRAAYDADFAGDGDVTGQEAFRRYREVSIETVAEVGGRIVWEGVPEMTLIGQGETWDLLIIVEFPSRAAFLQVQEIPRHQEAYVHRTAGLAATRLVECRPGSLFD